MPEFVGRFNAGALSGINFSSIPFLSISEWLWNLATAICILVPQKFYAGTPVGMLKIFMVKIDSIINDSNHHTFAGINRIQRRNSFTHQVHMCVAVSLIVQQKTFTVK